MRRRSSRQNGLGRVFLIAAVVLSAVLCHFFDLDGTPVGFYVDESSIGWNAYLIATEGVDEHGVRFPMLFEAFGEYKNPLYIYLLSALYTIGGFSEWTTRALSALLWVFGTGWLCALGRRLFPDVITGLYILTALAFTPWLFSLSRVAFELYSAYAALGLYLFSLHRGFHDNSAKWAFISGVALSASVYAYTSFRLLAPLFFIWTMFLYWTRLLPRTRLCFSSGAFIAIAPYGFYAVNHLNELTGRFATITYLNDPTLSVSQKFAICASNYSDYLGPFFLAISGDPNRRHHTGFGGELLPTTFLLLMLSVIALARAPRERFGWYLFGGFLVSPIAAALTMDRYHSLRSFPMVIFAIVMSGYGMRMLSPRVGRVAVALTGLAAAFYTAHYFIVYPATSAVAFENYDFASTLTEASRLTDGRIVMEDPGGDRYVHLNFFGAVLSIDDPMMIGTQQDLEPGDAFIRPTVSADGIHHYRLKIAE